MCPSMGLATFPSTAPPCNGPGTVLLTAINDFGGFVESRAPYSE